ncbi:Na(+)/dicarboxylate cotransporter 3-like [Amblyomma americanum]
MESSSAPPLRSQAASAAIVLFGYSAPLYALPIYSSRYPRAEKRSSHMCATQESRCAYSLLVLVVWTLMQVLPVPVACMFPPIVLAASDTIGEDDAIAGYTSPYVLHVVAAMLLIRLAHSLSLFDRAAMVVIRSQGARVRSLVLGFAALSLLATLFLDNGVTTMLMAALIERATRALQDNTIQTQQKKALFNKATRGFSRHRRKTLEDLLLRDTEQTDYHSPHQPLPQPESPTAVANDDEADALSEIREQPVKQYASPPQISRIARKSSLQCASKSRLHGNNAAPRRISIIDRGIVVLPGISSPTPPKKRAPSITTASFGATGARRMTLMTSALDTVGLRELSSWEKERCLSIQRDLLQGAVMVAVIGSIVSTRGNMANVFLFSYLRMRFARSAALHVSSWVTVVFPVVGCGLLACFSIMYFDLVRQYDAEEDENTRLEILRVIEKQTEGLGALTHPERFVLTVTVVAAGLWVLINAALSFTSGGRFVGLSEQQLVVLDYIMVALFSSAAAGWHGGGVDRAAPSSTPPFVDWRALCPHMHWGPLVIQGSVSCIARAMQVSGVTFWIQSLFNEFRPFAPTTIQIVLTVLSSVLTEFVSIDVTVTTLLPIVVDLALKIQCNPLYFAIPVTVASSTTLILPTAAMPIAILDDVVTLSRRKLLIHGTLVKVVTLTSLILSMNTLGEALFSWSELPSWALQLQSAPNASSVAEPPPNGRLVHSFRRG